MEKAMGEAPKAMEAASKSGDRYLAIDRAKGLGIILVVWGHLATSATPGLPTWFYISVTVIYSFHMPLFMYLSGFVFFLSKSDERFWAAPGKQIWKRFDRLMIPCIAFALLIVFAKAVLIASETDQDLLGLTAEGLAMTVTNAPGNPLISIWYLIVLFVYSLFVPILSKVLPKAPITLILLGLLLWTVQIPEQFYLARIAKYFIFFAIGGYVATHRSSILPLISRWYWAALGVLCVLLFVLHSVKLALLVCGIASLPAIHGLFMQRFWKNDRLFLFLGKNSMAIYLINTIAIGVGQIIYTRFLPYQDEWFLFYSPLLLLVGLLVPVAVRYALGVSPRLQFVKKYVD